MADIRRLTRKLDRMKQISDFIANLSELDTLEDIQVNLQLLQEEWHEYRDFEHKLKKNADTEDLQNDIESEYFKAKRGLLKAEKTLISPDAANCTSQDLLHNQQSFLQEFSYLNKQKGADTEIRLPRVNVPSFSGIYSEFPSFHDLFEASVGKNNNITKAHKLQYLKGLLRDEAADLIRHIPITAANYDEAWDIIKTRYDRKKKVISSLISKFIEQPSISVANSKSLLQMRNISDEVIRGLKVLGAQAQERDPWLIYILSSKLDTQTKQAWNLEVVSEDFPTLERFFTFLSKHGEALEDSDIGKHNTNRNLKNTRIRSMHAIAAEVSCPLCLANHYLYNCEKYLVLNVNDRRVFIAEHKLCFNCLLGNHQANMCRSRYKCKRCNSKHHTTLHPESNNSNNNVAANLTVNVPSTSSNQEQNSSDISITTTLLNNCTSHHSELQKSSQSFQSLLPTAMVNISDAFGKIHCCRLLLDSGAQASFISETCVQRLQLSRQNARMTIKGITSGSLITKGITTITACSRYNKDNNIEINLLILANLPHKIPSEKINLDHYSILKNLDLADPSYNQPGPIDIIIGADRFFSILKDGRIVNNNSSCIAQNTLFGWVISGDLFAHHQERPTNESQIYNIQLDTNIDEVLKQFWELEELPIQEHMNEEDQLCERLFTETTTRKDNGKFIVKLPFKPSSAKLGDSLTVATKRFLSLERKFKSDPEFQKDYANVILDYIELKHMEKIPSENVSHDAETSFYLPHHAVIKQSSSTTKVRVVFDGSSKSSSGVSLNERLLTGPTIQPSLWSTLVRFRKYKIAITADVAKMYRQVIVDKNDTEYQRILWRDDPSKPIQNFRLNTVTFGLASSAFLAIRCLQQTAHDVKEQYPEIASKILMDFYVDDFLSGANSIEEASNLKIKINQVLNSGGFNLRKWKSNIPDLNENDSSLQCNDIIPIDNNLQTSKVLGLQWNSVEDSFSFKVTLPVQNEITKRSMISNSSRIFDPLGWLAPSIVAVKILYQKVWLRKISWDDILPEDLQKSWITLSSEFKEFEKIRIPRHISQDNIELHGFADASERAYAAVIYCRSKDDDNVISTNIITSKTKVAPLKTVSLPRLELCAAHLLAKLLIEVRKNFSHTTPIFAWTDSAIVIAWLSDHPSRWKTFVANRTSDILERVPRQHWSHVKSSDNPADYASRGVLPSKLVDLKHWWKGPVWLSEEKYNWSSENMKISTTNCEERKTKPFILHIAITNEILENMIDKISSFQKLKRVLAYVYRFINNIKLKSGQRKDSALTVDELEFSVEQLIKYVQQNEFIKDINDLKKFNKVHSKSKILSLYPFLDHKGILRVGGRLANSQCEYNTKHPMILPKSHKICKLIIRYIHNKFLHPGPSLTSHLIRQQYWLIQARSTIRAEIKKCLVCFRQKCTTAKQVMGELPSVRVTPARAFSRTGVDYAGPIHILNKKGRGAKTVKGYIAVFVCMVTKAVHLELVSDLTSESFIASLKRFVARRGVPSDIYSDNATNFVGAQRHLREIYNFLKQSNIISFISDFLAENSTQWHFIPPASPHFGGLWEAAVKSVKTNLLKATHNFNFTYEEMTTLLYQIEAILNSRPLYPISEDDTSFEALTPSHFLIGEQLTAIPEHHLEEVPVSRLNRFQLIQQRVQGFWKRFSNEYFNTLQQRNKWQNKTENLQINDLVLIKEDNQPTCNWALGRVIQLHPGDNNLTRVVTVRTANTTLKRSIVKLCKLPISVNE